MWVAGILSVATLSMVDFAIAKILQRNPLEIQFLRALRISCRFLYSFLWPFAVLFEEGKRNLLFIK
jgi:hypothetical protein